MNILQLFFELIQVALGVRICLSRTPNNTEWKALYEMAKKQSLVGVCFAGVQRLQAQRQEPPEMLYLTWMGMAAKIQQRNEVANRQCAELGERLKAEGYRYSILKGQGVASLYKVRGDGLEVRELSMLRQSGDIDVLMWKDGLSAKENKRAVVEYAQGIDNGAFASEHHIVVGLFQDTEVEMHYAPAYLCNPFANKRLQKWFEVSKVRVESLEVREGEFDVPSTEFNLVFLLAHTFRHYTSEGVGQRQVMDYYFVLKELDKKACGEILRQAQEPVCGKIILKKTKKTASASAESQNEPLSNACSSEIVSQLPSSAKQSLETLSGSPDTSAKNIKNICSLLDSLNMLKFAGAMLWVINEVFEGQHSNQSTLTTSLGIEPNERLGRKLLAHIMRGGNFGHHNTETVASKKSHVGRFVNQVARDLKLAVDYPAEALWAPISMIREFIRIRI